MGRKMVAEDRRQYTRKRVEVEVLISCSDNPAAGERVAVYDISLSGMAIHPGSRCLEEGRQLCLCLSRKQGECSPDHQIVGTVMHTNKGLVGIRFDSVGIQVLRDIQRLLRDGRIF